MRKFSGLIFIASLSIFFLTAHAFGNFCCKDSNPEQERSDAFDTPTHIRDYSVPPGPFRINCEACETDMKQLRCNCQDSRGKTLYGAQVALKEYLKFYATDRGTLKGDGFDE